MFAQACPNKIEKPLRISFNVSIVSGLLKVTWNDCLTTSQMNDNVLYEESFKSIKNTSRSK